jgi:hypothetical protein
LVMCKECGSFLAKVADPASNYRGMICKSASTHRPGLPECHNGKVINEKKIVAYLDTALRLFLENEANPFLDNGDTETDLVSQQLDTLTIEIDRTENRIGVLIREQSSAADEIQPFYRSEIAKLTNELRGMKMSQTQLQQRSAANQRNDAAQQATREELTRLSIDRFWQQDSRAINQMLHRLMGSKRLVVWGGEIVGTAERPYRNRRNALPAALT